MGLFCLRMLSSFGNLDLDARKPVSELVNNKGAGQPAHPCRLLNTFAIRLLESVMQNFNFLASIDS